MQWLRNDIIIQEPIIDYLKKIIEEELAKGFNLKVCIGTDSHKNKNSDDYKFASVILILTSEDLSGVVVGRGGILIGTTYNNSFKQKNKELVNERMIYEVGKSIEIAYEISPLLNEYNINVEIHADINPNPNFESNKALQQAVGYILGMGYEFKIKPSSFAASSGADKLC
jgi:predicted RNase H-related nuclease YkuK (DUF458 family)